MVLSPHVHSLSSCSLSLSSLAMSSLLYFSLSNWLLPPCYPSSASLPLFSAISFPPLPLSTSPSLLLWPLPPLFSQYLSLPLPSFSLAADIFALLLLCFSRSVSLVFVERYSSVPLLLSSLHGCSKHTHVATGCSTQLWSCSFGIIDHRIMLL